MLKHSTPRINEHSIDRRLMALFQVGSVQYVQPGPQPVVLVNQATPNQLYPQGNYLCVISFIHLFIYFVFIDLSIYSFICLFLIFSSTNILPIYFIFTSSFIYIHFCCFTVHVFNHSLFLHLNIFIFSLCICLFIYASFLHNLPKVTKSGSKEKETLGFSYIWLPGTLLVVWLVTQVPVSSFSRH